MTLGSSLSAYVSNKVKERVDVYVSILEFAGDLGGGTAWAIEEVTL